MDSLERQLAGPRWGLTRACSIAAAIAGDPRSIRALIAALFCKDVEIRKRAADVARRISEKDTAPLKHYAEELAGLLAGMSMEESRTRWHLGLVVARVAHTREQRLRAARLMELLMEDESNVARCSAVEGIALLACQEASLRDVADEMIERALREGTLAMKCRAREGRRRLEKGSRVERGV